MRVRASFAAAVLALLAALGGSAALAATKSAPAVVVAGNGAVKLLAGDEEGQLCIGVRVEQNESTSCEASELGTVVAFGPAANELYAGISAPATATTVEVRRAGQLLAAGPTIAGEAYKGKRAGKVRFALLKLASGARADGLRVRSFDANGALVAVSAPHNEGELVFDRHRLLSGTYGGTRWSIGSSQSSALTPSVLDPAHETVSRCSDVRSRRGGSGSSSTRCVGAAPRDSLALFFDDAGVSTEDNCTPQFRLLHGIVDAAVQSVTFLLGDGHRRSARLAPLGDGRNLVYALPIPRDAAVRSVTFHRPGTGSTVKRLAMAPLAINCVAGDGGGFTSYGPSLEDLNSPLSHLPAVAPAGPITTVAGSPSFRVADGPGDSLCVALGDLPFNVFGCAVISPSFDELVGAFDRFLSPRSFVIALPARVAAIRIATADGKSVRTIATVAAPGYAGLYAGAVRFAAATVSATRELSSLDLLDAAGTVLHSERDSTSGQEDAILRFAGRTRIAGRAGHPSLWQTTMRAGKRSARCLALTNGPHPTRAGRCQAERISTSVLLDASCVSHRLTVAVTAAAGTRVRAGSRVIRLRRGAGLVTLPAKQGLASLTFVRKGKARTVRIDAPSGARQCGWRAARSISPSSSK